MQPKLVQSQIQKQIFTPSMQQSIEILLLPLMDLGTLIEQELQNNPLLEIKEEHLSGQDDSPAHREEENLTKFVNDILDPPPSYHNDDLGTEEYIQDERPIRKDEALEEHLLRQLRVDFHDPLDITIGELIIGNLNEDGYLTIDLEEIAQKAGLEDLARIETILKTIQSYEPLGIAARDLRECLLAQVHEHLNGNAQIAARIIKECMNELGQKKFAQIARKLKISVEDVKNTVMQITLLDPRPARNYRPVNANIYIKPDAHVTLNEDNQYEVHLNNEGIPSLRINSFYKCMLKEKGINKETKAFIREKLQNAVIFIKGIEQRGQTIKNIAKYIVERQKNFFLHGHSALVPMSLKDIATALERNESTISRAVNNKYIETPQGLYPFKFFFSQSVNKEPAPLGATADEIESHNVSNRSLKEAIKELVANEDKSSPLSDSDIQAYFAQRGMTLARRTVAKYRQAERILPSHLRKQ